MKKMKTLWVVTALVCLAGGCAWFAGRVPSGRWGAVGGLTVTRPDTELKNTEDKAIYLDERYELSAYRIPVPDGAYVVRLHFAETYEGITAPGERVFSVSIEGEAVLEDFDVYRAAGNQRFVAVVKEFEVQVDDGELTIEFQPKVQNAMVNGVEVVARRTVLGPERALRINCGAKEPYVDAAGHCWKPDQMLQPPAQPD
ncbi:MAG: malectin domain-containing carbohydrate-binding protein [Candidatus Brocadiia bacterium]